MTTTEPTDDATVEARGKLHSRASLIAIILFALPVVYVLSIGPVQAMMVWGWISEETSIERIEAFYEPLDGLKGTALDGPLQAYVGWWARMAERIE
jgi:hypothetical protein